LKPFSITTQDDTGTLHLRLFPKGQSYHLHSSLEDNKIQERHSILYLANKEYNAFTKKQSVFSFLFFFPLGDMKGPC